MDLPDRSTRPPRAAGLTVNEKIDVCRGTFAFLVVIAHGLEATWGLHDLAREVPRPTLELLAGTIGSGIFYVMGFFVISGYCIHLSVARLMDADRFPLKVYLVARLSRILPLYYIALLATVLIEWFIAPARPHCWLNGLSLPVVVSQLFVVQNLTQTFGSFAPSWSITNELIYYACYGVLAYLAARRTDLPARVGMLSCLVGATVAQLLYGTIARTPVVLGLGMLLGLGTNWFLGALLATHEQAIRQSRGAALASHAWAPILAVAMFCRWNGRVPHAVVFLLSGLAFALLMVRFLTATKTTTGRPSRLARASGWLGLSSYPTYLFHGPVLMLTGSLMMRCGLVWDWRLTWLVLSLTGIGTGIALGFVAEKPLLNWRQDLLRRLKTARANATPLATAPSQGRA